MKRERATDLLGLLAMCCAFICAAALALTSLFAAARIGPDGYNSLHINIVREGALINQLIVVVGILLLAMLSKIHITKKMNRLLLFAMMAVFGVFGIVWAASVNAYAESDGDVLIRIAEQLVAKDYTEIATQGAYLHYYLVRYPYQCGLLSFIELLVRMFGSTGALGMARSLNVVLLMSAYAGVMLISERLFQNDKITFLTILLLATCIQPVFSCTFVYGLIPAFALCVWAVYFVVRYLQSGKKRNIIPVVALLTLAAYVRSNTWIVIAAIAIVLLFKTIRTRSWLPLLFAIIIGAVAMPAPKIAQTYYENEIGTTFGSGFPKTYWIAMSLQNGWKATGWQVKGYQYAMESEYGEDMAAVAERTRRDIQTGVRALIQEPGALSEYLFEKLVSQWDEPTFTSIWITETAGQYADPEPLTTIIYSDQFDTAFRFVTGKAIKLLYFSFALGVAWLLRKRAEVQMILPLIILGGVLFHLIFEAKSQYVLEYLPLFAPIAAYGVFQTGKAVGRLMKRMVRREKLELEEPSE